MADGYGAYRDHALRLRCWAHLIRKARALAEGFTPHVQGYGRTLLAILESLRQRMRPQVSRKDTRHTGAPLYHQKNV